MPSMTMSTITRDGRTICFHTTGVSDADRCVVFLHPGPGSGDFDPDPAPTGQRDVLLLGVDRPGYGGSDPYPRGEWPTISTAVDDVVAVLEHLGVTSAGAAGWSGGGRIALGLAARRPHLVDRVAILATPAPNEEVRWVPPEQTEMVEQLATLSVAEARAHLAQSLGSPSEPAKSTDYWMPFLSSDDADTACRDDPAVRARLDRMLQHGMASGAGPLADDILSYASQPWGFRPDDVQAKTLLLYGMADGVVKGAHARWWKDRLPNSRVEMMPKLGHLLVVPAWKRVMSHLATGRSATAGR
jgi:pimeloyl-ACP methyl ester carboxylesterase